MKTNNILYIDRIIIGGISMLERMKQGFIEWVIVYAIFAVTVATFYVGCRAYEYLTNVVMF